MKKSLVSVLFLSTLHVFAQKTARPDAYAKTITADALKKHLFIVAGAEMEGRETATPGQRRAAAYIENQFQKLGLLPGTPRGYQMQYPVYQDTLLEASLQVNGKMHKIYNT